MVVLNVYDMVSAARPAPLARGSDPGPAPPPPADARVGEGSGVVFQSSRASVLPGAPRAAATARVDGGRPRAPARRGPRPWARHPAEECPSGPASLAGPTSDSQRRDPGCPPGPGPPRLPALPPGSAAPHLRSRPVSSTPSPSESPPSPRRRGPGRSLPPEALGAHPLGLTFSPKTAPPRY